MGTGWDQAAREQLAALDAALYSDHAWDGNAFWRSVRVHPLVDVGAVVAERSVSCPLARLYDARMAGLKLEIRFARGAAAVARTAGP